MSNHIHIKRIRELFAIDNEATEEEMQHINNCDDCLEKWLCGGDPEMSWWDEEGNEKKRNYG